MDRTVIFESSFEALSFWTKAANFEDPRQLEIEKSRPDPSQHWKMCKFEKKKKKSSNSPPGKEIAFRAEGVRIDGGPRHIQNLYMKFGTTLKYCY